MPHGTSQMTPRMPLVFVPHGGGPWPFVPTRFGSDAEKKVLADHLRALPAITPTRPTALLVVSAHWEAPVPTVQTSPHPPMLYDYSGFPPESYTLTWPAPGSAALASRVRALVEAAGFASAGDDQRGYDHGAFVPLKLAYPEANIPTVQLSLVAGLDPAQHLALGRALAPLRDEGVFIIGSGMSYHNMRGFGPKGVGWSEAFDAWLRRAATAAPADRDRALTAWTEAPMARQAHPREEHLLPLMVIAGAAGEDRGAVTIDARLMGIQFSGYQFG